jgi:hypothetical protein
MGIEKSGIAVSAVRDRQNAYLTEFTPYLIASLKVLTWIDGLEG